MFEQIIDILIRKKWQIITLFLVLVACVTVATLLMPKSYETHMKILVKNERAAMVVSTENNSGSAYQGEVSETQINTEIELLKSDNLLEEVVIRARLDQAGQTSAPKTPEQRGLAVEKAVRRLHQNLEISPVKKADIIEVKYSSHDPHQAATILRQFADSYLEAHLRVHSSPGTHEFFATQAVRYQASLDKAEADLAAFRQRSNVVLLGQQQEAVLQKSLDSESKLLETVAAIGELKGKVAAGDQQMESASDRVVTQSRTVPNQYVAERLSTMMAELQNKRIQLLLKFRPDDRAVLEVDQEIAGTQSALDKAKTITAVEQTTDINAVRQDLQKEEGRDLASLAGLEAKRTALQQQAKTYREELTRLGNEASGYDNLVRRQKEAEDNYLLYSKKSEEARIAESLDRQKISNVAIVEKPSEAHLPSKPNVMLNILAGSFLAAVISLGIAFAQEYSPISRMAHQPSKLLAEGNVGLMKHHSSTMVQHLFDPVAEAADLEELTDLPVLAELYRPVGGLA